MSAGAPATASKYTLCATLPKAKVIEPPGTIFAGDGLKAMLGVAFTVAVMGGGPGGGAVVVPGPPPPHADRSARKVKPYGGDVIEADLGKGEVFAAFSPIDRTDPGLIPASWRGHQPQRGVKRPLQKKIDRRVDLAGSRSTYR
jgi:hypothetical protein